MKQRQEYCMHAGSGCKYEGMGCEYSAGEREHHDDDQGAERQSFYLTYKFLPCKKAVPCGWSSNSLICMLLDDHAMSDR